MKWLSNFWREIRVQACYAQNRTGTGLLGVLCYLTLLAALFIEPAWWLALCQIPSLIIFAATWAGPPSGQTEISNDQ